MSSGVLLGIPLEGFSKEFISTLHNDTNYHSNDF